MKLYALFPRVQLFGAAPSDERARACIATIAEAVLRAMRSGGDDRHFTLDGEAEGRPVPIELRTEAELLERLIRSVDPSDGGGSVIRSAATCRAVAFGYDGQAFLCLRHDDEPPALADPSLATVEERPDLLLNCDYLDGRPPGGD